jgi:hypothetical protein
MKHEFFIAQMGELLASLPVKDTLPQEAIEVWWKYFQCLPPKVFSAGIRKVILTHEYSTLPTIGEVAKACVGGHYHLIPAHRRPPGDADVDEIMKAYQERYEKRLVASANGLLAIAGPVNGNGAPPSLPDSSQSLPGSIQEEIERLRKLAAKTQRDDVQPALQLLAAPPAIDLHTESKRRENENEFLRRRVANLEKENAQLSKALADQNAQLRRMGKEMADLEAAWRNRPHG